MPATSATGSPTVPTAATRLDVVSDTRGDTSAGRGHGDQDWLGMLCQGCCDAGGMWCCGTRMETLPKLSSGCRAVSELCQGLFTVTPGWGRYLGALCHSKGLGTLCHGTRLVVLCLGTLCPGTGLGTLCLSHAQCHRTILGTLSRSLCCSTVLAAPLGTLSPGRATLRSLCHDTRLGTLYWELASRWCCVGDM